MENSSHGPANFWTQSNALLRKNLLLQKRNKWANIRLITFPVFLFIFMAALETYVKIMLKSEDFVEKCNNSTLPPEEGTTCPIRSPVEWPPLLEVPSPSFRAVRTNDISFKDLPDMSCKKSGSCPATILITGNNQSLGKSLGENMFTSSVTLNSSDTLYSLANAVLGSSRRLGATNFRGLLDEKTVYQLQPNCTPNSTFSVPIQIQSTSTKLEVACLQSLQLWRDSPSEIKDELFKGYYKGNSEGLINEIVAAYDFLNTNQMNFNVSVWYNSSNNMDSSGASASQRRVPRSVNLVSNAYLQFLRGPKTQMVLEFIKEMPKNLTSKETVDLSSMLATLLFTFVILQLFPVILTTLVYEKQQRLRIMMKMHGLCDGPYWMISYGYFLAISSIYMLLFVLFGSLVGLRFFTLNSYSIQFVFYFVYINVQILFAFLLAAFFSRVKPATASAYAIVFGTGLAGKFLFESLVKDTTFPRGWITFMEFYPGFSLQRGLYEFSEYALMGSSGRTRGMLWHNLNDSENGMKEILIIMLIEWFMLLFVAYYLDQVTSSGSGIGRSPLFFFQNFRKKPESSFQNSSLQGQESDVFVQMEKADVAQEREKVEQLLVEPNPSYAVVCNNLAKVYPGRDGNPEKVAVKGLSLALRRGECFGMLGPSGAGKTSFIEMMIGLMSPSSGRAYVEGLDLQTSMDAIYTCMGVCPQHDLLWETLTGREHLLFYGRLKKLEGAALNQAVEDSLKNLGIFHGGVADKAAGSYSGGMKRRLSVAISLIGNPSVVYMDEPSTGLDPASRNTLWNVVKRAKQERAIILTTHSMEEAEFLCDRLGIFVDGSMQCVGNPKELRARYGGSYVFTITTSANHEDEVESMVRHLSSNANKTYHLSGTQKFELPKNEVRIAEVFEAVANAKKKFTVHAWGLADTTLEDVFIKVAHGAEAFKT